MAVAHSAASESHAATTGSVSQTSFSWTHTQTGTPQGVLVFVHVANSTGDPVSSVTYGSVTLTRVDGGAAIDSAGEAGRTDLFFAGSDLGTGNQTITVNRANTTNIMYASAATVTAATNTNVTGIVLLEGDGALTVQSVTDGGAPTNSLRYAAAYSGLASPPPAGTGSTLLNSIDFGNYGIALVRETTAGTGARDVGFNNATTDDRAAVHVAVRELWNRTDTETVGAFTLTGQPNTLAKSRVMTGDRGAFTLTGQPADLRHNPDIEAGTGAFTHTGRPADLRIGHAIAGNRGAFTLTGQPNTLAKGRVMTGNSGKFFLPERNVIKQSEQFDNINNWRIVRANALANNTAAPDGSITAEFIRETATTGTHVLASEPNNAIPAVVGPASYTFSCHLKANGRNATLRADGGGGGGSGASGEVLFDLATGGTTTLAAGTITASGATDAGNGWYRCWISFTTTQAGTCRADIYLYSTSTSYTGDGTSGIYAWGAQLEQSASLTEYDPTGLGSVTPITFKYNRAITAGTGAFTFTGNDATLTEAAASKVLTAEVGAFAFTGNPATLAKGRTITAETGTFTAAGQPATLRQNPRIEANTGSFALSGGAPALLRGRYLSGGAGEFIETGQPTTFRRTWAVQGGTGTFALTGNAAGLVRGFRLTGDAGKFFLPERNQRQRSEEFNDAYWTKTNASIIANATTAPDGTLTADALIENTTNSVGHSVERATTFVTNKTYTHSCYVKSYPGPTTRYARIQLGNSTVFGADTYINVNLATGAVLSVPPSGTTYTVTAEGNGWYRASITRRYTGAGTTQAPNIQIINTSGIGLFTGADGLSGIYLWGAQWEESESATDYDPTGAAGAADAALRHAYRLDGGTGAFSLAGQPATFRRTWVLQAATGNLTLTGNPAALTELGAYEIDPIAGSFTLAGQPANLAQSQTMPITVGAFAFTGQPATLRQSQALAAEAGPFTTTGQPAALTQGYRLDGGTGAFSFTGQPATLAKLSAKQLTADTGAFSLAGQPAALNWSRLASADRGLFTLAGQPATLRQDWRTTGERGQFLLTGNPAALTVTRSLLGGTGVFTFTGNPAGLADTDKLAATTGAFILTGLDATLLKTSTARRRNVLIF